MKTLSLYADKIEALKQKFGPSLVIMGHHYQQDEIMQHVDLAGDSLQLAQMMEGIEAEHIVFCGVHFMAESAKLLAKPGQKVYLPDMGASCLMAEMVPAQALDVVIEKISAHGKKIVPLAYVNTSLAVKAIVGKHGGAVCTSSNAKKMLEWAYGQGESVLFLPDRNLGSNVGNMLGIAQDKRHTLDVRNNGENLDYDAIDKAKLIFWDGCCPIHEFFKKEHVASMRQKYPQAKIYVHPECPQEIVAKCDGAGSTSYLIDVAEKARKGDVLIIGTEANLVNRLARVHEKRGVTVIPLFAEAFCPDMAKITEALLYKTLENIAASKACPVGIDGSMVEDAKKSLVRMLNHCAK